MVITSAVAALFVAAASAGAAVWNPTITVSKEEAQLALARVKAKTDPDGARKILESLRTERAAISKAAMSALGELAGQTN